MGVSPGTSITGFPPGTRLGTTHQTDAVAAQAQSDVTKAYDALAGAPCSADKSTEDLTGQVLVPGVYCFTSEALLSGLLILDGQGDPNSVFMFKVGSALTASSGSRVQLINGASPCSVFWKVGSSATIDTGSSFVAPAASPARPINAAPMAGARP